MTTGTSNHLLDRLLADGPQRAPDRLLDRTLEIVARTPQRRAFAAPWRQRLMSQPARLALAAAAVIVVMAAGGLILASRSSTSVVGGSVAPPPIGRGGDDTANLQAALDACVPGGPKLHRAAAGRHVPDQAARRQRLSRDRHRGRAGQDDHPGAAGVRRRERGLDRAGRPVQPVAVHHDLRGHERRHDGRPDAARDRAQPGTGEWDDAGDAGDVARGRCVRGGQRALLPRVVRGQPPARAAGSTRSLTQRPAPTSTAARGSTRPPRRPACSR